MKKLILILPFLLLACAGIKTLTQGDINWIQIGPTFEANKGEIAAYANKEEITRPYGYVGVGRIDGLAQTRDDLRGAMTRLKKAAAQKGADAVIISQFVDDQNPGGGVSVSAHAIKYVDNLSNDDKNSIEEYKILGAVK